MRTWQATAICTALLAAACSAPPAPRAPANHTTVVELTDMGAAADEPDIAEGTEGDTTGASRPHNELAALLNVVPDCPACAPPERSENNLASVVFQVGHYARRVVLRRRGEVRLSCEGPVVARGERAEIFGRFTLPVAVETPAGCTHVLTEESGALLRLVVDSSDLRLVPRDLVRLRPEPSTAGPNAPPADDPLSGVWLWPGASVRVSRVADQLDVSGNAQGIEFRGFAHADEFGTSFIPLETKDHPETTSFIQGSVPVLNAPGGPVIATVNADRWPVPIRTLGKEAPAPHAESGNWLQVLIHEPLATTPTVTVIGYIAKSSIVQRRDGALFTGGLAATRAPAPTGPRLAHLKADTALLDGSGVLTGRVLYDTDFSLLPDGRVDVPTAWGNIALSLR